MVSTVVAVERFLQNAVSTMQLVHSKFGMKGGGSWQNLITVSTKVQIVLTALFYV